MVVGYAILFIVVCSVFGCASAHKTQFLTSDEKPTRKNLEVRVNGAEYTLSKGEEIDYVYRHPDGVNRSQPIYIQPLIMRVGTYHQRMVFETILVNALKDRGFIISENPTCEDCYTFHIAHTYMQHGSRFWNWFFTATTLVPQSTAQVQLEGKLLDSNGNAVFIFVDKRVALPYVTKSEVSLNAKMADVAADVALELDIIAKP